MKPASFFADELLNKYCMPIKDGTGVIEEFVRRVQEDALHSAADKCLSIWQDMPDQKAETISRQNGLAYGCVACDAAIRRMAVDLKDEK